MLLNQHITKLYHSSGISEELVYRRGYRSCETKAELKKLGFTASQQVVPTLLIPLCRPGGDRSLYMHRPDAPRMGKGGRIVKYEQIPDVPMVLDVPPVDWMQEIIRNPSQPLVITEGPLKADSGVSHGIATVALPSVWCWIGRNEHGGKMTIADLYEVAWNNRPAYICFDSDIVEKYPVWRAAEALAETLRGRGAKVKFIVLPYAANGSKQGLDDFFASGGTAAAFWSYQQSELPDCRDPHRTTPQKGDDDVSLARQLLEEFDGQYAFDPVTRQWRTYERGLWMTVTDEELLVTVSDMLATHLGGVSNMKAKAVREQLAARTVRNFQDQAQRLLPMENGVLNLDTMTLEPFTPAHGLTWKLPYAFDPQADCPVTQAWLYEAMGGNEDLVTVLRAYVRAILLGRADLQVYLEIHGIPGTGKGTYLRLCRALIGEDNTASFDLKTLENGRFATNRLYGMRLAYSPDTQEYVSGIDTLLSITGGDPIPYELKNKNVYRDFVFHGMVIIAANEPLQTPYRGGALMRRRISVPFEQFPEHKRTLLEYRGGQLVGELLAELPGVLNWALAMSDTEMCHSLSAYGRGSKSTLLASRQALLRSNHVADWAEEALVYMPGAFAATGDAVVDHTIHGKTYKDAGQDLYPTFLDWCDKQRIQNPPTKRKFVQTLVSICQETLRRKDVETGHSPDKTRRGIKNIRLRRPHDEQPAFITELPWGLSEAKSGMSHRPVFA